MKITSYILAIAVLVVAFYESHAASLRPTTIPQPADSAAQPEKSVIVEQLPAVVRHDGKSFDILQCRLDWRGKETGVRIETSGGHTESFQARTGHNSFLVRTPVTIGKRTVKVRIGIDGNTFIRDVTIEPIRDWTVYLVEHTHTDIGYPEPQHEINPEQLRYIDYALDYCDMTDKYPDDAKFRWTCETAWAVKEYLRTRPKSQVDRLLRRIKEGRIEVTGLYLNMSDLYDEATLSYLLKEIRDFRKDGIDVRTAMQDDVNGAPWCLVDYLSSAGVKYFSMGENPGHARRPFDRPTAFWWESPSGARILAYRGEHYHIGNWFGILSGSVDRFSESLLPYLLDLKKKGDPFDEAMLQFSGYFIDDSPPSISASRLVEKWNSEFEWPKLKLATIGEFFGSIRKRYGSSLPTYRLAWPDWWTDGAGSCALETSYIRDTQAGFIANQGLISMAALLGAKVEPDALSSIGRINDNIAFFDEHTFGAAGSVSQPLSLNTAVQWNEKSAFAWTAVKENGLLREESLGLLRSVLPKLNEPSVTVFNTMNVARSGIAQFFAYDRLIPPDKKVSIVDEKGDTLALQKVRGGPGGNYWDLYVRNVPGFGYRTYRIVESEEPSPKSVLESFHGTLENDYYRVTIDSVKGGITGVFDKSLGRELVDSKAPWELGQFIYERLSSRRLISGPGAMPYSDSLFTRTSMTDVRIGKVHVGPIWTSVDIRGEVEGCADTNGVRCEVRIYNHEKRLQLVFSMNKLQVFSPEAAYVAFPFESRHGRVSFEVQGGSVVPGVDQFPGSASDWDGVQNFARVADQSGQIVFTSPQTPLMEFGAINTGKYQEVDRVEHPYMYSYVLNNYWVTNFRAGQEGGLRWEYDITSSADSTAKFASDFGWGCRLPLTATLRPGGGSQTSPTSASVLDFGRNSLLLVFARPAWNGDGFVLCLRETDGRTTALDASTLTGRGSKLDVYEINSLEENMKRVSGDIKFRPYQVRFLLLRRGR